MPSGKKIRVCLLQGPKEDTEHDFALDQIALSNKQLLPAGLPLEDISGMQRVAQRIWRSCALPQNYISVFCGRAGKNDNIRQLMTIAAFCMRYSSFRLASAKCNDKCTSGQCKFTLMLMYFNWIAFFFSLLCIMCHQSPLWPTQPL